MQEELYEGGDDQVITLKGMYQDYFLDYASYVILERAVPAIGDGLKPVQRRILHALNEMDDGRFHKVANVIGQTMQFHPHGDAAIGDALVNLGQKDLLIDCQGNWGDVRTGDGAAAPRYIEARLTKFALEVLFNPQTTEWQLSYDGRKKEPITLPVKFPLLLAQGVEGIAVGLSTKILPHNFVELVKASIQYLKGRTVKLYPDFQTGGYIDVADYQSGHRGGKIRVRAKIEKIDKTFVAIRELPYGVTTSSMIDSIVKASEKGKIKIKKVVDNTAKDVEILIELQAGVSPDVTIDALYAFTDCEISISPNACVIVDDKPRFTTVEELLKISTDNTVALLKRELEIKQAELLEKWLFASLEKIFIEKRIYRDIEECETWEEVLQAVETGLRKYVSTPSEKPKASDKRLRLWRELTEEDFLKLTEIRIKRISKFNSFKADEYILDLEKQLAQVKYDLENLIEFSIKYFQNLLDKYGKGKERRTQIINFEKIEAVEVVANNTKLYVNRTDGFIGWSLKKDEFVCDCSDLDDIIVFRKDGKFQVSRISEKTFMGKDILHVAVWKKGDERTTYHLIYLDGKTGTSYAKRFNVTGITRDKEYDLTTGNPNNKTLYFAAHPNGETEKVTIYLHQASKARIKEFNFNFAELDIKNRGSVGNIVTKYPVRKVLQLELGKSSLGALQLYWDEITGRIATDARGKFIGAFDTGDKLFILYTDGTYEVADLDMQRKWMPNEIYHIGKFSAKQVVSAVYYDGNKGWTLVKRFQVETTTENAKLYYLTDHSDTRLLFATVHPKPIVSYKFKIKSKTEEESIKLHEFIDVKGWKAQGNKLSEQKLTAVKGDQLVVAPKVSADAAAPETNAPAPAKTTPAKPAPSKAPTLFDEPTPVKSAKKQTPAVKGGKPVKETPKKNTTSKTPPGKLKAGDSIEFNVSKKTGKAAKKKKK